MLLTSRDVGGLSPHESFQDGPDIRLESAHPTVIALVAVRADFTGIERAVGLAILDYGSAGRRMLGAMHDSVRSGSWKINCLGHPGRPKMLFAGGVANATEDAPTGSFVGNG